MPSRPAERAGAQERGFVLVGVVMFVLALTILGLSLFALSSYEGQFVDRSHNSGQALDAAMSGLEHAKFVLTHKRTLEDVGTSLYPTGVVYASARRADSLPPDTVGSLDALPPDVNIAIRVLANVGGERRMVEAQFTHEQLPQVYKRLMSISDSMYARPDAAILPPSTPPDSAAYGHYLFRGEIWAGNRAGQNWTTCLAPPGMFPSSNPAATLPAPNVKSFFDEHLGTAPDVNVVDAGDITIQLRGTAAPPLVNYFRTINNDPSGHCSLFISKHFTPPPGFHTIEVTGWVVWMLPHGFRSEGMITVMGTTGNDCLVIVAGASTDDDAPPVPNIGYLGIEFSASIESHVVPVILVTDGWVFDEHFVHNQTSTVSYLSVFAHGASFWGPVSGLMDLNHASGDPRDGPGGLIDLLCEQQALPNAKSGGVTFKSVAGTWRELDPDTPPWN